MENRCWNGLVLPLYPPAASPAVMKNNGFIPEGRGPQVTPPPPPHPAPASLQWLCWQANRWLGWVASGLRALSVIKERKKVYGLLVSVLPTDGMSSKHPPIPNLLRGLGGGVEGVGVGSNLLFWKQSTGLGIKLYCAVQFGNLSMKQVKWVKFNWRLNIYDHIYIMLMHKRLLRWMQIFPNITCRSLVRLRPLASVC